MTRIILFTLFISLLFSSCEKDYSVSGTIIDRCSGKPIPNILVKLSGCGGGGNQWSGSTKSKNYVEVQTYTNGNGQFILQFSEKKNRICEYMSLAVNVGANDNYTSADTNYINVGESYILKLSRLKRRLDIKISLSPNLTLNRIKLPDSISSYWDIFKYDTAKGTYFISDDGFGYSYLDKNPFLYEVTLINNSTNDTIVKTDTVYFDCSLDTLTFNKTY